jgi:hypothetical protein
MTLVSRQHLMLFVSLFVKSEVRFAVRWKLMFLFVLLQSFTSKTSSYQRCDK